MKHFLYFLAVSGKLVALLLLCLLGSISKRKVSSAMQWRCFFLFSNLWFCIFWTTNTNFQRTKLPLTTLNISLLKKTYKYFWNQTVICIYKKICTVPGVSGNSRSCSQLFPRMIASDSRSRNVGMDFFISFPFPNFGNAFFHCLPVPKFWECFFSFPSRYWIFGMQSSIPGPVPEQPKAIPVLPCTVLALSLYLKCIHFRPIGINLTSSFFDQ